MRRTTLGYQFATCEAADISVHSISVALQYTRLPATPDSLQCSGLMTHSDIEHTSTQLIVERNTSVMPGQDVRWDQVCFGVRLVKLGRRQHVTTISCVNRHVNVARFNWNLACWLLIVDNALLTYNFAKIRCCSLELRTCAEGFMQRRTGNGQFVIDIQQLITPLRNNIIKRNLMLASAIYWVSEVHFFTRHSADIAQLERVSQQVRSTSLHHSSQCGIVLWITLRSNRLQYRRHLLYLRTTATESCGLTSSTARYISDTAKLTAQFHLAYYICDSNFSREILLCPNNRQIPWYVHSSI